MGGKQSLPKNASATEPRDAENPTPVAENKPLQTSTVPSASAHDQIQSSETTPSDIDQELSETSRSTGVEGGNDGQPNVRTPSDVDQELSETSRSTGVEGGNDDQPNVRTPSDVDQELSETSRSTVAETGNQAQAAVTTPLDLTRESIETSESIQANSAENDTPPPYNLLSAIDHEYLETSHFLYPVTNELHELSKSTSHNPHELLRLLMPIGKFIIEKLRTIPPENIDSFENKLCQHIAKYYWPLRYQDITYLIIRNLYQGALKSGPSTAPRENSPADFRFVPPPDSRVEHSQLARLPLFQVGEWHFGSGRVNVEESQIMEDNQLKYKLRVYVTDYDPQLKFTYFFDAILPPSCIIEIRPGFMTRDWICGYYVDDLPEETRKIIRLFAPGSASWRLWDKLITEFDASMVQLEIDVKDLFKKEMWKALHDWDVQSGCLRMLNAPISVNLAVENNVKKLTKHRSIIITGLEREVSRQDNIRTLITAYEEGKLGPDPNEKMSEGTQDSTIQTGERPKKPRKRSKKKKAKSVADQPEIPSHPESGEVEPRNRHETSDKMVDVLTSIPEESETEEPNDMVAYTSNNGLNVLLEAFEYVESSGNTRGESQDIQTAPNENDSEKNHGKSDTILPNASDLIQSPNLQPDATKEATVRVDITSEAEIQTPNRQSGATKSGTDYVNMASETELSSSRQLEENANDEFDENLILDNVPHEVFRTVSSKFQLKSAASRFAPYLKLRDETTGVEASNNKKAKYLRDLGRDRLIELIPEAYRLKIKASVASKEPKEEPQEEPREEMIIQDTPTPTHTRSASNPEHGSLGRTLYLHKIFDGRNLEALIDLLPPLESSTFVKDQGVDRVSDPAVEHQTQVLVSPTHSLGPQYGQIVEAPGVPSSLMKPHPSIGEQDPHGILDAQVETQEQALNNPADSRNPLTIQTKEASMEPSAPSISSHPIESQDFRRPSNPLAGHQQPTTNNPPRRKRLPKDQRKKEQGTNPPPNRPPPPTTQSYIRWATNSVVEHPQQALTPPAPFNTTSQRVPHANENRNKGQNSTSHEPHHQPSRYRRNAAGKRPVPPLFPPAPPPPPRPQPETIPVVREEVSQGDMLRDWLTTCYRTVWNSLSREEQRGALWCENGAVKVEVKFEKEGEVAGELQDWNQGQGRQSKATNKTRQRSQKKASRKEGEGVEGNWRA